MKNTKEVIELYPNGMKRLKDGTLTDIPYHRYPGLPANVKQEDSLLNATEMSKESCNLLAKICENHVRSM